MPRRPCSPAALLLAPALISTFWACGGDPPPAAPTARAESKRIERIVVATGTIEPAKEVEVRPRIPGIVDRILVKEGEPIVAGQLLVEIERELLEAQTAEAAAELEAARVERHYAQLDLDRARELEKSGAVSSQKRWPSASTRTSQPGRYAS